MKAKLTAVFRRVPEGYIAFVEEHPWSEHAGSDARRSARDLREAVQLVIEANRELAEQDLAGPFS